MMKQSPSRNQRRRGWKLKHVLQIIVLVAVCVWLVYQVKLSHDKRKALEGSSSKLTDRVGEDRADLKLGRKDPRGNVVIIDTDNTAHSEVEENDTAEEAALRENKQEENEEGKDIIGNLVEENGGERADDVFGEVEVKERGGLGDVGSSVQQDHEGADGNSQDAREENYKADDASSAVVRDTQEIGQENEEHSTENSEEKENKEQEELENDGRSNATEDASKDGGVQELPVDGESQQSNSTSIMETAAKERELVVGSLSNSTVAFGSIDQHIEEYGSATSGYNDQMEQEQQKNSTETVPDEQAETQNTSAEVNAETVDSTPENATQVMEPALDQNSVVDEMGTHREDISNSEDNSTVFDLNDQNEQQNISTGTVLAEQVETQNVTADVNAEPVDSTPETLTVDRGSAQDHIPVNETTTLVEDNSDSDNIPREQNEKSGDGSDESLKTSSSTDVNSDAGQGEVTSSSSGNEGSVTEGERDARTHVSTLPEVDTASVEGVAAE